LYVLIYAIIIQDIQGHPVLATNTAVYNSAGSCATAAAAFKSTLTGFGSNIVFYSCSPQ
jgi:hypothetical protein